MTQIAIENIDNELLTDEIIDPINSYLDKNKGATDYHIIKDLTDRACDKVQDEVDSYNPVPLYLGLCGTMLGIIMGIFFLWLSGGLDSLLASNIIKDGMDAAAINAARYAEYVTGFPFLPRNRYSLVEPVLLTIALRSSMRYV